MDDIRQLMRLRLITLIHSNLHKLVPPNTVSSRHVLHADLSQNAPKRFNFGLRINGDATS